MQNNTTLIAIGILIILIIGGTVSYFSYQETAAPSAYDGFAQCLKDNGVKFFGAFWCPHCAAQKALFGTAVKLLPYEECSTPDGQGQNQLCKDNGIKSYPTWVFADHSTTSGELPLATLAEKSGCELPAGAATAPVNVSSSSPAI